MTSYTGSVLNTAKTFAAPPTLTSEAIHDFLQAIDSPRSLAVWILFKGNEHRQILELTINPADYANAYRFRDDYLATEFLSKSTFLNTGYDLDATAMKKFFEFEELCRETNSRFSDLNLDPLYKGSNVWLLNAMTRKICEILGDFTPEEFFGGADWGPGVSTLVKGEHVSAFNKFRDERGITQRMYSLVKPVFHLAYPAWHGYLSRESGEKWTSMQDGNSIVTVPKNSKTNRVIAIEPGINLWFQKSIGRMIRRRLLRRGVDLTDQTTNQQLALQGSLTGDLATVDFSSASDSISKRLVEEIIPSRWFSLMDSSRSFRGTTKSGTKVEWEKFSSMGNGFTFELESLIFYCAALAVQEYNGSMGTVNAYGDDVILPSTDFELFSSFSAFLGFRVNPKKSFSSTGFRESCGSHWYDGVDCKPIFLKEKLTHVKSIYKLANSVRMLSHRRNSYRGCDYRFLHCWARLRKGVPKSLRLGTPAYYGDDTGFVSNFDEACPTRARDGTEGYLFNAIVAVGVTTPADEYPLLLSKLGNSMLTPLTMGSNRSTCSALRAFALECRQTIDQSAKPVGNAYVLRGRTRMRVTRILVPQWYNLGPWI